MFTDIYILTYNEAYCIQQHCAAVSLLEYLSSKYALIKVHVNSKNPRLCKTYHCVAQKPLANLLHNMVSVMGSTILKHKMVIREWDINLSDISLSHSLESLANYRDGIVTPICNIDLSFTKRLPGGNYLLYESVRGAYLAYNENKLWPMASNMEEYVRCANMPCIIFVFKDGERIIRGYSIHETVRYDGVHPVPFKHFDLLNRDLISFTGLHGSRLFQKFFINTVNNGEARKQAWKNYHVYELDNLRIPVINVD